MRQILFILFLCFAGAAMAAPPKVGDIALAWSSSGGREGKIIFHAGPRKRPAILLFWATWCPYCRVLMPHVQQVLDDVGSRALDVYALDILEDEGADPAAELRARGQTFTLVTRAEKVAEQYGVVGTPTLLLVDREGKVSYVRPSGAEPGQVERDLRARLSATLAPHW